MTLAGPLAAAGSEVGLILDATGFPDVISLFEETGGALVGSGFAGLLVPGDVVEGLDGTLFPESGALLPSDGLAGADDVGIGGLFVAGLEVAFGIEPGRTLGASCPFKFLPFSPSWLPFVGAGLVVGTV